MFIGCSIQRSRVFLASATPLMELVKMAKSADSTTNSLGATVTPPPPPKRFYIVIIFL